MIVWESTDRMLCSITEGAKSEVIADFDLCTSGTLDGHCKGDRKAGNLAKRSRIP